MKIVTEQTSLLAGQRLSSSLDRLDAELKLLRTELKSATTMLKCMFVVGIAIELFILIGLIHSPI